MGAGRRARNRVAGPGLRQGACAARAWHATAGQGQGMPCGKADARCAPAYSRRKGRRSGICPSFVPTNCAGHRANGPPAYQPGPPGRVSWVKTPRGQRPGASRLASREGGNAGGRIPVPGRCVGLTALAGRGRGFPARWAGLVCGRAFGAFAGTRPHRVECAADLPPAARDLPAHRLNLRRLPSAASSAATRRCSSSGGRGTSTCANEWRGAGPTARRSPGLHVRPSPSVPRRVTAPSPSGGPG